MEVDIESISAEISRYFEDKPTPKEITSALRTASEKLLKAVTGDYETKCFYNYLVFLALCEIKKERAAKADTPNYHQNNSTNKLRLQGVI